MHSLIRFFLRLDRNFAVIFIILYEDRGIVDECPLDRATLFLPRLLFVVKLESYDKNDHFVNIYADLPLFSQSF